MQLLYLLTFVTFISSCSRNVSKKPDKQEFLKKKTIQLYTAKITQKEFFASYKGADFVDGDDIAHQLSNFVADTLGKHLKMEYKNGRSKKSTSIKRLLKQKNIIQIVSITP